MTTPKLRFGTVSYAIDLDEYAQLVRTADDIGLELIGHGDSPCLWHDPYVALAVAAHNSTRARIGPIASNPVTRHPTVTAAALASLQALSGGRAILGLGGGDSAVLNIGRRPARIPEVVEYATAIRELTAGRRVTYQGQELALRWTDRAVPVFLAAEGPRKLRLAGAIADGVVVSNGITRDVVQSTIQTVRAGAAEAGRDPDTVEIWWLVNFAFADSERAGWQDMDWLLAAEADHVFRFTLEGKFVPDEHRAGLLDLMAHYAHDHHAVPGGNPNGELVHRNGLLSWLGRRFAVTGTVQDCVARIREIAGYGATNLLFTQLVPDQLGFLRKLGDDVIAPLRG